MMTPVDLLRDISFGPTTLEECLFELRDRMRLGCTHIIIYGFFTSIKARNRNDCVMSSTGGPSVQKAFHAMGGSAADIVAANLESYPEVSKYNMETISKVMHERGDSRRHFGDLLMSSGARTGWICPVNTPEVIGYAALNHFVGEGAPKSIMYPDFLQELASGFHAEMMKGGQLVRELGLTDKEIEALTLIARGKTAIDISLMLGLSKRAVEMRLQTARSKLRARTSSEAIFKATAYGAIPKH